MANIADDVEWYELERQRMALLERKSETVDLLNDLVEIANGYFPTLDDTTVGRSIKGYIEAIEKTKTEANARVDKMNSFMYDRLKESQDSFNTAFSSTQGTARSLDLDWS